ncbi:hypothetical protein L596_018982 [Steinernema carpocapsae]|uniref:FH2 domain-containing protein n=1 Tax=Steinernema carpocapsae TaxID=34508 RepID=A0A4U5N763_STECR|nr:hypothetical protein L596_018982 [Steinernema carpocapsae]
MTSLAQPPSTATFGSASDDPGATSNSSPSPVSPKSDDLVATTSSAALFQPAISPSATTAAPTTTANALPSIFHQNPDPYHLFQLLAQHVQNSNAAKQNEAVAAAAATAPAPPPKVPVVPDLYSILTNSQNILQNPFLMQQQQQNQLAAAAHQQQVAQQQQQQNDKKRTYPYTFQYCVLCQKNVHSSKLPCHIRQCHVAKPMFQCPACDFTSTYSKNNVKSHMVSLHGLAGDPISYMDQYAGQVEEFMKKCFPNVRGRGRPMHGGKRASPKLQTISSQPSTPNAGANTVASQLQAQRQRADNKNYLLAMNTQLGSQVLQRQNIQNQRKTPNPAQNNFAQLYAQAMASKLNSEHVALPGLLNPNLNGLFEENNNTSNSRQTIVGATVAVKTGEAIKNELWENGNSTFDTESGLLSSSVSSTDDYKMQSHNEQLLELSAQLGGIGNAWRGPDSDSSGSQSGYTVQPGENMQPRYLAHHLDWSVLNADQLANTIFETFGNAFVDKVDISKFEQLTDSNALLTSEQLEQINAVRQKMNKESFEVLYAVAKLQTGDLTAENIRDLETIAPSAVDIQRFKSFAEINNISSLSDDEKFIFDLAKIERFEEKLFVLSYAASFSSKVNEMKEKLKEFMQAAKMVQNSMAFNSVLQLTLICGNYVCGYFNAQIVRGFRTSTINELCQFKISENETLLDVLADALQKDASFGPSDFTDNLELFEKVGNVEFSKVLSEIKHLETGQLRAMAEIHASSSPSGHNALIEQLTNASQQFTELNDLVHQTKDQLITTLQFFGEPVSQFDSPLQPEVFFAKIALFGHALQKRLQQS